MKKVLGACLTLVCSLFAVGCHIENHDGPEPADSADACGSYCARLYDCGAIPGDEIGACIDQCNAKLASDEAGTRSACQCVLDDECRAFNEYDCPGAPFPTRTPSGGYGGDASGTAGSSNVSSGGSTSSSGGATSSGGSASSSGGATSSGGSASGSGGAPLGCEGGYDCAADEDCVDGACRQRCSASCQCPTDLSCVDHYCRSSAPPPMCTTDCECASGQHCLVGGICG